MKNMVIRFFIVIIIPLSHLYTQNWVFDRSPISQNLARLDMLSDSLGWAVSYDGMLLKYNGRQWIAYDSLSHFKKQLLAPEDPRQLKNEKLGDIYTIRVLNKTSAWLAINNIVQRIYKIVYFDILQNHYSATNLPVKIRAIDFWNPEYGIAVGQGGGYWYKNGKWVPLILPVSVDFKCVKCVGSNEAFICGEKGILLRWDGEKWEKINTKLSGILRDMDFISENEGWIVGYNGIVLHYQNGRLEQELAESVNSLWAVDMLNAQLGYAVGKKGTLLKYNGVFWDKIKLNTDIDFHDIEMLKPDFGFVIGARSAILKYSNQSDFKNTKQHFLFADQVHLGSAYLMDRIDDVYGVTVSDFNDDGLTDIYITCYRSLNHLLLNTGNGYYRDFVIESGTGGNIETRVGKQKYEYGALAADFDRDGDTDLLLAGKRNTTRYFTNNGKAVFNDLTRYSGLPRKLEITDGALADFNEDGYPDFVLADQNKGVRIFLNLKYNRFRELNLDSLHLPQTGIRTVKVADINNDNHQDIMAVFQNYGPIILLNSHDHFRVSRRKDLFEGNWPLFVNSITFTDINRDAQIDFYLCTENGKDALFVFDTTKSKFVNVSRQWGVNSGGRSYSCVSGDFNLDGYEDLFIARYGKDYLYLNRKNQSFIEVAGNSIYSKAGYLSGYNTGAACLDFDNNGRLDLIVGNSDYWSSILQNLTQDSSFVRLRWVNTQDTKEALGVKLWAWPSGKKHTLKNLIAYQQILPSAGLFSQYAVKPISFGKGIKEIDCKVRFLNGTVKEYDHVKKGSLLTIRQTNWPLHKAYQLGRSVLQFLHIPDMIWEVIKFILFIALILVSVRFIEQRYRWRPAHTALYVLSVITVYIILNLVMEHAGVFYHILPFAMILFTLLVLIAVNEPIRQNNLLSTLRQKKLHDASLRLSASPEEQQALDIVRDTLEFIHPFYAFWVYTYHFNGNYFLLKKRINPFAGKMYDKVVLEREIVRKLKRYKEPLPYSKFSEFWPGVDARFENSLFFPLIRKDKILGVALVDFGTGGQEPDTRLMETVHYLFLQLAIALDNIRILNNLQDQEKIAAIGTFSGGIIHNLKNPIDGLRMIIEVLNQETDETDSRKEYVNELYKGIMDLKQKLIHSFDFVDSDRSITEQVLINDLIKDMITSGKSDTDALFQLELDEKPFRVRGDQEKLTFALENLIRNAIEASDLSQTVVIRTRASADGSMVEIEVQDQGKGIPSDEIEKIFTMFFSTKGKNRGLGLTITRNIINNHNGFIDVLSDKGTGTVFRIMLPLIKETHE